MNDEKLNAIDEAARRAQFFRQPSVSTCWEPNGVILQLVEEIRVLRRQMRNTSRELTNEVAGLLAVLLRNNGSGYRFSNGDIEWGQQVVRENRLLFERSPDGSLLATVHAEEPEKIYFSNVHDPTNFNPA